MAPTGFVLLGSNYATRKENISSFAFFDNGDKTFKIIVQTKVDGKDVMIWALTTKTEKEAQEVFSSIATQLK